MIWQGPVAAHAKGRRCREPLEGRGWRGARTGAQILTAAGLVIRAGPAGAFSGLRVTSPSRECRLSDVGWPGRELRGRVSGSASPGPASSLQAKLAVRGHQMPRCSCRQQLPIPRGVPVPPPFSWARATSVADASALCCARPCLPPQPQAPPLPGHDGCYTRSGRPRRGRPLRAGPAGAARSGGQPGRREPMTGTPCVWVTD